MTEKPTYEELEKKIQKLERVESVRKKAEEALRESEERYKGLFMNMGSGVAIYEVKGDAEDFIFKDFNKAAEKIEKQKKEALIGRSIFEARPQVEEFGLIDVFREVWKTGKSKHHPIARYQDTELNSWYENFVYKLSSGEIVTIFTNETDRKQVEEALQKSEEKYRLVMESMKDEVYICSPDYRIKYMNPSMINRLGHDATNEVCHKIIYNNDEKCSWCVFDQVQQGKNVDYEVADPKNNHYYSVTNSPILHADRAASKLTIFHDITEIKNIEAQLRQSRKMESIGTLAGGIAHDFNNILYIILGNTELALGEIPKGNPAYSKLEEIKSASLRASRIIKQLLNFTHKTDHKLEPIGAVTVIQNALNFLRSTIPATIEIRKHLTDDDMVILADPIQINRAMMNICANASLAMEATGGILEVIIEPATIKARSIKNFPDLIAGKYAKITIRDQGPGIKPETIQRIFDPYFTTNEKSSGMGLSIVQGIVKNHNGAIWVDSRLGKGTTITLLFPVVDAKPKVEIHTIDELTRGTETILFVDDEEPIRIMGKLMLKRLGYKVKTCQNPREALDLFQSEPDYFDLVITDMTMPGMTGAQLSEKLLKIRPDIPIILCTGHSSFINEAKAKKLGMAGYIMKPMSFSRLAKSIRTVLDK